jgi:hypothetical protein
MVYPGRCIKRMTEENEDDENGFDGHRTAIAAGAMAANNKVRPNIVVRRFRVCKSL